MEAGLLWGLLTLNMSKAKKSRDFWGAERSTFTRLPLYKPATPLRATMPRAAAIRLGALLCLFRPTVTQGAWRGWTT